MICMHSTDLEWEGFSINHAAMQGLFSRSVLVHIIRELSWGAVITRQHQEERREGRERNKRDDDLFLILYLFSQMTLLLQTDAAMIEIR
jgi:hypothetical protein